MIFFPYRLYTVGVELFFFGPNTILLYNMVMWMVYGIFHPCERLLRYFNGPNKKKCYMYLHCTTGTAVQISFLWKIWKSYIKNFQTVLLYCWKSFNFAKNQIKLKGKTLKIFILLSVYYSDHFILNCGTLGNISFWWKLEIIVNYPKSQNCQHIKYI